ncbi:hypothetical protein [Stenotrophomonas rhizophila]|uniref:hypothetical protein n=1 Tax=Stenotrophomonas rhizophila TaxID=216778 RepID=UPI001E5FEAC3|nr:hypothetical protein [Stenotrophomonas rhizophila]MCC7633268.1 hypothetical protein [Stenotrophomonas rhizophila]MCC7662160.1 hypothetical protein [Stenotrophomonas rhizophila]
MKIAIRTSTDSTELTRGQAMIAILSRHGLAPEQVSFNPDRFKEEYDGEAALEKWWAAMATVRSRGRTYESPMSFAWRRKKVVKSSGYVTHRVLNDAGELVPADVGVTAQWDSRVDWRSVFRELINIFPPQIAMLHLFTSSELGRRGPWSSFEIGSFGAALDPQPPNLAWSMFFGEKFSKEGNRDQIRDAGFKVDELLDGYLIELTGELGDVGKDFENFSTRRAMLKSLYRPGMFRIDEEPSGG